VLGRDVRVLRDRGRYFDRPPAEWATVTVHPSSILRAPDRDARFAELVDDLVAVRLRLEKNDRSFFQAAEAGITPDPEQLRMSIEGDVTTPTKSASVKNETAAGREGGRATAKKR